MGEVIWYNKGSSRKRQIYDWLRDVINSNNLTAFISDIKIAISRGHDREAYNRFTELIDYLIARYNIKAPVFKRDGDILAYLIEENIQIFGKTNIVIDLFEGIIRPMIPKGTRIEKPKRVRGSDIKEVIKEVETEKRVFGINKEGNREEAHVRVRIGKSGEPVKWLQSVKTGKVLGHTKAFKESVKRENIPQ